ncbi:MAG: Fe-S cluster assembly ATPase SufC [Symbiobacterium sp.]|uniref:Fe-S cluster assembly ATPase SufC n=1 Tax=Symbiobacterium sp. TaxID=1971213 RepID=UPI003463D183
MTTGAPLIVKNLHVSIEGKEIIKGLDLEVKPGEIHAIMGPNGAGKTTLGFALMGHPRYEVTEGTVMLGDQNVLEMDVTERAKAGLFLAFQYPFEVSGVTVANFLRQAVSAVRGEEIGVWEFQEMLAEKMQLLEMDESFAGRYLNEGFSGGEKKRNEMLQMTLLQPKIAILDETDSGLDIDALKVVAKAVNSLRGPDFGAIVITHYHRILDHIRPDVVHVLMNGRIVKTGGPELALEIEKKGYDWIKAELGIVDETAEAGVK